QASAWPLFAPHHYLNSALAPSAVCFLASWNAQPVAFSAWLPFVGAGPAARRGHRTVTQPDFQGAGIGKALSATIARLSEGPGLPALPAPAPPRDDPPRVAPAPVAHDRPAQPGRRAGAAPAGAAPPPPAPARRFRVYRARHVARSGPDTAGGITGTRGME